MEAPGPRLPAVRRTQTGLRARGRVWYNTAEEKRDDPDHNPDATRVPGERDVPPDPVVGGPVQPDDRDGNSSGRRAHRTPRRVHGAENVSRYAPRRGPGLPRRTPAPAHPLGVFPAHPEG